MPVRRLPIWLVLALLPSACARPTDGPVDQPSDLAGPASSTAPAANGKAQPSKSGPQASRIAQTLKPADFGAEQILVVHYHRPTGDYAGWNLWAWHENADGMAVPFTGTTPFGRYAVVRADGAGRVGLLVRKNDWESKDIDHDRFAEVQQRDVSEIWLVSGDHAIYTDPATIDLRTRIVAAFLDTSKTVYISATGPLEPGDRSKAAVLLEGKPGPYKVRKFEPSSREAAGRAVYELELSSEVKDSDVGFLSLQVGNLPVVPVFARDVLTEARFTPLDAVLGNRWTKKATSFRVWSPVSRKVDLLLYGEADTGEPKRVVAMQRAAKGLWEAEVEGDLHGVRYAYRYSSYGQERIAPDIHTFAATADSSRSVVVDLARCTPDGWGTVDPPLLAQPTDEVIYEIHVRDFSVAAEGLEPVLRGTYRGLLHRGQIGDVPTGLGHLEELGVTAVHLLPIQDFTAAIGEYNWGYWTALFNVPEGNYSTNPHDPTQPIRELKTAIAGLHAAGLRVILDVVYNHTSSSGEYSPFDQSVPYYYFRTTVDGRLMNDAGVGNSMADERPMVRKYIVDSLAYWTKQYRIDGYRFDLIGTHRQETVAEICRVVTAIRPDITLYGEPWTGGGHTHFPKGAQRGMRMAVFNDHLRNAIRGDLDGTSTGLATGPGGDYEAVKRGVAGAIDDFTREPIETVNYVSAHDNLTFWDKLVKAQPSAGDAQRRAMAKLAHGIVLTSQGIAFIHGGCDFARTKQGNHNSYNAGDAINLFDWPRKVDYRDVNDYIAGLIRLRRSEPAFRLTRAAEIKRQLTWLPAEGLIAFTLDDPIRRRRLVVVYNGEPNIRSLKLPGGAWDLVVNETEAGVEPFDRIEGTYELPGYSMMVAWQDR